MIPRSRRLCRRPVAGDVVVTKVARHYHVGRVQTVGTVLLALAVANRRDDALAQASEAATCRQRIFLFEDPDTRTCIEIGANP